METSSDAQERNTKTTPSKRCRTTALYAVGMVLGASILVLGACTGLILVSFLRSELIKLRTVDEDRLADPAFLNPDEQRMNIYIFNVTNAEDMQLHGADPSLTEHKISLMRKETKHDAILTRDGEGYSFTSFVKYTPDDDMSRALLDAPFIQVNPAYVSAPSAVMNPANDMLDENTVLALMSPLIVAQVRDLFENTLPVLLKVLSVPGYLIGVQSHLSESGLTNEAIIAQWAGIGNFNDTLYNLDPEANALLRNFEAAPVFLQQGVLSNGVGVSETIEALWDVENSLSLVNDEGAKAWLALVLELNAAEAPGLPANFPDGSAGQLLSQAYTESLVVAVAGYLQALISEPAYESFIFHGLAPHLANFEAPGTSDIRSFADLSYSQYSGEVAMRLMTQGAESSVAQLGLDERVICAPEIASFLSGRHGLSSTFTPQNAKVFLSVFSDSETSTRFLTELGNARATGDMSILFTFTADAGDAQDESFLDTGITLENIAAVGDYLFSYLPQDFFVKGHIIGFRRDPAASTIVGLPEELLPNAGGAGHVNSGLFTRRTGAELLHGWEDPLFQYVPQELAAVELKWRGALGTNFASVTDQLDVEDADFHTYELRTGRSDTDKADQFYQWKGMEGFALQSDLTQPAMPIRCPSPGNHNCTVWEKPEIINGALSGAMIPPFTYDFCAEARKGRCERKPKKLIDVWFGQLLRRVPFRFDKAEDVEGLFTYRYVPEEAALLQPNANYGVEESAFFPMAKALAGAPLYGSLPYLAFAPRSRREGIIWPKRLSEVELARAASVFLNVEPFSGFAVKGRKAYQFNWMLSKERLSSQLWSSLFSTRDEYLIPYMWIEESAIIETEKAGDFANALYVPQEVLPWIQATLLLCGASIMAAATFLKIRDRFAKKTIHPEKMGQRNSGVKAADVEAPAS